ncbi:Cu(I)-responsive transcriptional regulator [Pseudomonas sp. F1_0610]|uniref:Cu(I)-responsive transcriptional regulator n=1 Tax=Pseudomonas sp. F1_0610 TaxID=3114284 RepID=UPI0039C2E25F
MNIGEAAKAVGITAKMIRYYEQIELLPAAQRTDAGYRIYSATDLESLAFIKRARDLGFSLERIKLLLQLWHQDDRQSADVKALAQQYLAELDKNIEQLQQMRNQLAQWIDSCHGDARAECSILNGLTN